MKKLLFTTILFIVAGSLSLAQDKTIIGGGGGGSSLDTNTVKTLIQEYSIYFNGFVPGYYARAVGTDSIAWTQPFTQIPIGIDSSHTNTTDTTWITVTHTFHADTIYCTPNNLGSAVSYTASILYRKAAGTTVTQMGTITVTSGSTWTSQTTIANPNIPNDYQVGVCFTSVTTKGNGEVFSIIVDYLLP